MIGKKPELLVTAKDLKEVDTLIDSGADAITVGSEIYGLRIPGNFSLENIRAATDIIHKKNAKIYILMNALMHNEALIGLDEYLRNMAEINVDGIVFGDPAVLVTAKDVAPNIPLHWNTETTATNFETVKYWAKKGIKRAILARELSLEEVVEIKRNVDIEVQAQVHGITNIFHSKRSLITNYFEHTEKNGSKNAMEKNNMFLREHERPDEKYPVFEDIHGTHVMSSFDICMIDYLNQFINGSIDSLKIDGLLYSTEYLRKVTKLYREAIDRIYNNMPEKSFINLIEEIQPPNRPLSTGFYYKEQIY